MGKLDDLELVHCETRAEWRAWLAAHHATSDGIWLVTWKRASGRPVLAYDDLVLECLAFGWVDSRAGSVDADRSKLVVTPRRPGSGWSRPNKERIERLEAEGLMTDAGRAVIEAAKADGSWTLLDEVEDLIVPPDLTEAFARHPGSAAGFDAFSPSARKQLLQWIVLAKRPATRADRVEATAAKAAVGERAYGA